MNSTERIIKEDSILALVNISRWTRILAVMIITSLSIGTLMFLLFLFVDLADIRAANDRALNNMLAFYTAFVVISVGVNIYPVKLLIDYRKHIKNAAATDDSEDLHKSIICLRNLFRYVVFAILGGFALYLLTALIAMLRLT